MSCHYCLAESHLTALIHYTFVLSPHLPRMFFSDVFTFSEKRVPPCDVFRPIPLRFLVWIMITKGRIILMLSMSSLSLTSLGVYPHPFVSADCKRLVCFCESLFRLGAIHSRSFDNLGLFFDRLRGPRPYLIDGNGYEAWQTSKEQTKMPRFVLEGPQPCKIYFCAHILCMNYITKTFLLVC